jgi:hypothetical protein
MHVAQLSQTLSSLRKEHTNASVVARQFTKIVVSGRDVQQQQSLRSLKTKLLEFFY